MEVICRPVLKLLPTQCDRDAFVSLVDCHESQTTGRIADAYHFFERLLSKANKDELDKLLQVVTSKLVFVSITLASDDNAYLIFESLNFKGMPLTQADLIRNYFLMRIHRRKQETVYSHFWEPMQVALGDNQTEFIRHYLMMENGQFVKKDEVYSTLKTATETCTEDQILAYLTELKRFSTYYVKLLKPETEENSAIRKRLVALNRLEVTTAYPFLLKLYAEHSLGTISTDDLIQILGLLETFVIRRYICGVPSHGLNKFFPTLYAQAIAIGSLTEGCKQTLSSFACPRDAVFKDALLIRAIYGTGERLARARHVLESIEDSFCHKEGVSLAALQVEHIMPQTLTVSVAKIRAGESAESEQGS